MAAWARYGVLFACTTAALPCVAEEIAGFRMGMSIGEARRVAEKQNIQLRLVDNAPSLNEHWKPYFTVSRNISMAFCRDRIASLGDNYKSPIHEFVDLFGKLNKSLGTPEIQLSQLYHGGQPNNTISYRWQERHDLQRSLSFSQWGSGDFTISFGFFESNHACR
jgi:hypothetical protein